MKKGAVILCAILAAVLLAGCEANPSEEGVKYLEEGKYKEAQECFEDAIEKDINAKDAYRGLGIICWEQQDYEGAVDAFVQALKHEADKTATIYNLLGSCEMQLGNPHRAVNYYRLALGAGDGSQELLREVKFNMIAAYEQGNEWENAKAKLAEYLAEYPDDEKAKKEAEFLETR